MEFFVENWFVIVAMAAVCGSIGAAIWRFWKRPTDEQIQSVKEWLLGVVTDAERELGGGTGALKLRRVYDLFVARFPWLAKVVPFSVFAEWVDEALVVMREMLEQNVAIKSYVGIEED